MVAGSPIKRKISWNITLYYLLKYKK